jgi:hypothetical protein
VSVCVCVCVCVCVFGGGGGEWEWKGVKLATIVVCSSDCIGQMNWLCFALAGDLSAQNMLEPYQVKRVSLGYLSISCASGREGEAAVVLPLAMLPAVKGFKDRTHTPQEPENRQACIHLCQD